MFLLSRAFVNKPFTISNSLVEWLASLSLPALENFFIYYTAPRPALALRPLLQAIQNAFLDDLFLAYLLYCRFDQERFNKDKVKQRHSLASQPFRFAEKRKCPGYRFAYYEAYVLGH